MDVTFDRDAIIAALTELADELVRSGTQIQIRVVGGAAISVAFDRETTTTDVDAMCGANSEVENAARTIAYRNGWPENWLNDNVKQFASHFDRYYPEEELSERALRQLNERFGGSATR